MSATLQQLDQAEISDVSVTIRNAGIAGAGGAGFPAYAKWERADEVDYLMVNHQESEPNYYVDKWLGRERAEELATLFDALLDRMFDAVVLSAKAKDRESWLREFEGMTDATIHQPGDLPLDPEDESGVVIAYTEDQYEYGMESVLLRMVADTVIGRDLPMDHGWIVQNTETLYNVYRTLKDGDAMTHKLVHVDGKTPRHRFLEVPIGTTAPELLAMAGLSVGELGEDDMLLDGGPGWCFEVDLEPEEFGVRKRTNCLLVLERDTVDGNRLGEGRVNVLGPREWDMADHETAPSTTLSPSYVRIPLMSNPAFEGIVSPSRPIVDVGDSVEAGEMIATPAGDGISNAQHASIDGKVSAVTDTHVEIRRHGIVEADREWVETGRPIYWTWCRECGAYVVEPETSQKPDPTEYVCRDCR